MTMHVGSVSAVGKPRPASPTRHTLTDLDPARLARHLVLFTPTPSDLGRLIARGRGDLPNLAALETVHRVMSINPDAVAAIARRDRFDAGAPEGEGFIACLTLNDAGLRSLLAGRLDGSDPDPALLSRQHERPAGIYLWAIHAPGRLSGGVALALERMSTPTYAGVDFFARAATRAGADLLEALGFVRGAHGKGLAAPQLHMFARTQAAPAIYDSYRSGASGHTIAVARTLEDLARVISVRSAVYMAEQACPYDEEFDGNDLSATHLLGYVGGEPAGCLRIRFFADFAKIERLAVRSEHRASRLSFLLVRAGIELARVKGYRRIYGHAQKRLVNFWSRFGFRVFDGARELVFSDFDYVEMLLEADRHPEAIALGIDPYVIIRPEGRWHLDGTLDRSRARPVTRPSVDRPAVP